MTRFLTTAALAALLCACGGAPASTQTAGPPAGAGPIQIEPPNARDQKPAFAGQTRAPQVSSGVTVQASDYVTGLQKPWGMAFLPDGSLLITEKAGRLRLFSGGQLSGAIAGLPPIDSRDQGGLLGVAVDPDFARNGLIYVSYSQGHPDGKTNTAVARGKLVREAGKPPTLTETKVIWRQDPAWDSTKHFGSRLVFNTDGTLFITTGERSVMSGRMQAQNLGTTLGKVVRISTDGSIPKDNPFVGRNGVKPEIWSYGHRNVQSAALDPSGRLWEVEHGARGGDELNLVKKGADYGWPTISYGLEYSGAKIGGGITSKAGMQQPVYYWDPVIAPSGMAFYNADLVPAWRGSVFVGGLKVKALVRLVLKNDKVTGEEWLLTDLGERIRDVVVGPDGALYVATDSDDGRIVRVAPAA